VDKRKLTGVIGLTFLSQIIAFTATLLIQHLGSHFSDTYALANQVGMVSFGGFILGVLYNLAIGRAKFNAWMRWATIAGLITVIATVIELFFVAQKQSAGDWGIAGTDLTSIALFGAGGSILCYAGAVGVKRACEGLPSLFSGATILPNFGYLVGILFAICVPAPIAPAIGWLIGCIVTAAIAKLSFRKHEKGPSKKVSDLDKHQLKFHTLGLVLGVISSSFMPLFFSNALLQLAPGTVYWATLFCRIATAAVSLFVNSVLLVKYRWGQNSEQNLDIPLTLGAVVLLANSSALAINFALKPNIAGIIFVGIGFLLSLVASAITIRELNSRRLGKLIFAKTSVEILLTLIALVFLSRKPTFEGYLAAFGVSQAFTMLIGGIGIKRPSLIWVSSALLFSFYFLLF